eukprot:scaffold2462_cov190-Chaetoceros_neogracile.AAC.1
MTLLNSQTGNLAASGDEEKQNLGEETTSLLKLKQEIRNQKASVEALQIEVKSLLAHKLREKEIGNQKASVEALQIDVKSLLAHKLREEEIGNQKASFEALQIEFKSLRAHVDNTNTHVLRPTSSSAITKQDSDTDNDLLYTLPSDTFTLMMVYNPLTPAWNIGIFSFILQMLLLILILISQINEGDGSTPFNVPFKVDNEVRIGQFAVIIVCVLSQDDVLTSLQSICTLWKCDCTAFQDLFASGQDNLSASGQDDLSASGQDDLSASGQDVFVEHYDLSIQAAAATDAKICHDRKFYALHILLPNLLKFAQGVFVLLVSLVIIAQGEDLIDLLKDSTALFFVSAIDNVIFFCANTGYFGQKVGRQAQATTKESIIDGKKWSFKARIIVVIIIGSIMIAALSTVTYGQVSGNYFKLQYPDCDVTDNVTAISKMKNGICDGGELNTLGCAFDGGDCINHNLAFPGCNVEDPEILLGNGVCDGGAYNTAVCGFEGGDCGCDVELPFAVGNGVCDGGVYNIKECGFDGGDCDEFNTQYPDCNVNFPESIGDGVCNGGAYNTTECGFDEGDCVDCNVEDPYRIGDGYCDGGAYNTADCGFDGRDCDEFNFKYPNCNVDNPYLIGNGSCNNYPPYNTADCEFDGGDCDEFNFKYPNCNVDNPYLIGNGSCNNYPPYNTAECGFDGGDCVVPNYPDCRVEDPGRIGDGRCLGGEYNTIECGFDGGDCDEFNAKYPNCNVIVPDWIGDGICNDFYNYDTAECGFDGGDCEEFYAKYPNCNVGVPGAIGDGECNNDPPYNTAECGFDGGDCVILPNYPDCRVNRPEWVGDGYCDGGDYNITECGFDGGDCL